MDQTVYVCMGSCKAEISEEKFKNGLTKCGTVSCTLFGKDFKKMTKCSKCGQIYSDDKPHTH
jgi:hypothetical protein